MIRDKLKGSSASYCFIVFPSRESAQKAVSLNSTVIPGTNVIFKLNWALNEPYHHSGYSIDITHPSKSPSSLSTSSSATILATTITTTATSTTAISTTDAPNATESSFNPALDPWLDEMPESVNMPVSPSASNSVPTPIVSLSLNQGRYPEYSMYVGGLASNVTSAQLLQLFRSKFFSVRTARIMIDAATGLSRCYGFVRFTDESEYRCALTEMQGCFVCGRPIRISPATPRSRPYSSGRVANLTLSSTTTITTKTPSGPLDDCSSTLKSSDSNSGRAKKSASVSRTPHESPFLVQPNNTSLASSKFASLLSTQPFVPSSAQTSSLELSYIAVNDAMLDYTFTSSPWTASDSLHATSSAICTSSVDTVTDTISSTHPISTTTTTEESTSIDAIQNDNALTDDLSNTTVFIGGLYESITDSDIRKHFGRFGEIVYTRIPPGKACGFVQFTTRQSAEAAIAKLNGTNLCRNRIRLSWGRPQPHVLRSMQSPYTMALSPPQQLDDYHYLQQQHQHLHYKYAPMSSQSHLQAHMHAYPLSNAAYTVSTGPYTAAIPIPGFSMAYASAAAAAAAADQLSPQLQTHGMHPHHAAMIGYMPMMPTDAFAQLSLDPMGSAAAGMCLTPHYGNPYSLSYADSMNSAVNGWTIVPDPPAIAVAAEPDMVAHLDVTGDELRTLTSTDSHLNHAEPLFINTVHDRSGIDEVVSLSGPASAATV